MKTLFPHNTAGGRVEAHLKHGIDRYLRRLIPAQCERLHSVVTFIVSDEFMVYGNRFTLLSDYAGMIVEEKRIWEKYYLPTSVKGKIVLDVGAGCGETAAFYLQKGAERVIAIESNRIVCSILRRNVQANNLNVTVIEHSFRLTHLSLKHDFLKLDIEGGERALLCFEGKISPCILEVHESGIEELSSQLMTRFGLRKAFSSKGEETCLLCSP